MSTIDKLAELCSELTGSEFLVGRVKRSADPKSGYRYVIGVKRGEHEMTFGETNVDEAKGRLAMIADLVTMGFVSTTATD